MIGQLIDLPKIIDTRGNLTVVEQMRQIPFDIARVYWTYDQWLVRRATVQRA